MNTPHRFNNTPRSMALIGSMALILALLLAFLNPEILQAQDAKPNSTTSLNTADDYIFFQETDSRGESPLRRNHLFMVSAKASSQRDEPVFTVIHQWPNAARGAEANFAYLTKEGLALVTAPHTLNGADHTTTPANASPDRHGTGAHGVVRLLDVDGSVLWEYIKCDYEPNKTGGFSAGSECLHHDLEPRSNGNILVTAHQKISRDYLETHSGWQNDTAEAEFLWVEKIYELKPIYGPSSQARCMELSLEWNHDKPWCTEMVWTLDLADYLGDNQKDPRRININTVDPTRTTSGLKNVLLHINSIDFNENLQQVLLSSALYSEIYIFDYSNKDLIYRWGNPRNYECNGASDVDLCARVTQRQHDATWTSDSSIMIHNNNQGTKPQNPDDPDCAAGPCSKIIEIQLPEFKSGTYKLEKSKPFYPYARRATDSGYTVLYGPFATGFGSGVQRYTNGDLLITKTVNREMRRVQVTSPPGGDEGFYDRKNGDWLWSSQMPYFDIPTSGNKFQPAECRTQLHKRPCPMIFKFQLVKTDSENMLNLQTRLQGLLHKPQD